MNFQSQDYDPSRLRDRPKGSPNSRFARESLRRVYRRLANSRSRGCVLARALPLSYRNPNDERETREGVVSYQSSEGLLRARRIVTRARPLARSVQRADTGAGDRSLSPSKQWAPYRLLLCATLSVHLLSPFSLRQTMSYNAPAGAPWASRGPRMHGWSQIHRTAPSILSSRLPLSRLVSQSCLILLVISRVHCALLGLAFNGIAYFPFWREKKNWHARDNVAMLYGDNYRGGNDYERRLFFCSSRIKI